MESVQLQIMFLDIYIDVGGLLALPVMNSSAFAKVPRFPPAKSKICSATKKLRAFLDYVAGLDDLSLVCFTVNDWTRLITVLTLCFRLSFPLELCLEFDWEWANSEIQLDRFLTKLSGDSDIAATASSNSLLSANRAVLGVLKSNYTRRFNLIGELTANQQKRTYGCPVMGGNLGLAAAQFHPGHTPAPQPSTDFDMSGIFPVFHDTWPMMVEGWQDVDNLSWDSLNDQLDSSTPSACSWPV